MRKISFSILALFCSLSIFAQENKCYCDLANEAFPGEAKKAFAEKGEFEQTVPRGFELWIVMKPTASHNQGENGGCRLRPGEKYVAVSKDGIVIPVKAWECGNPIIKSGLYKISTETQEVSTTPSTPSYSEVVTTTPRINRTQSDSPYFVQPQQQRTAVIQSSPEQQKPKVNNNTTVIAGSSGYQRPAQSQQQVFESAVVPFQGYSTQKTNNCIDCGTGQRLELQPYTGNQTQAQQQCCVSGYTVAQPSIVQQQPPSILLQQQFSQKKKNNFWLYAGVSIIGLVIADAITGNGIDGFGIFKKNQPGPIPGDTPVIPENDPVHGIKFNFF